MLASSGDDPSETSIIVPGFANNVWNAAPMLSTKVSLSRFTVTSAANGAPGAPSTRHPEGVETAIDLTPTLARILCDRSAGNSVGPPPSKASNAV